MRSIRSLTQVSRRAISSRSIHRSICPPLPSYSPSNQYNDLSDAPKPLRWSPSSQYRGLSSTPRCYKKGAKAAREEKRTTEQETTSSEDPSDFTALEAEIATLIDRLKNDLSKLRAGGRFNTELLEVLRVQLDKNDKQTVKLGDIAQIIPKGRTLQILVAEKDYVKPVSSAIQGSNLSLTPQPDPTGVNPLLLTVNIPPPTTESRKAVVAEASKLGEKAATILRDARGKQQKKHRAAQLAKSARPDDLRKAGIQMEKVVEKAGTELKRLVDNAKKVLESG